MSRYYMKKELKLTFEETIKKTKDALEKEGFSVLTEIDVRAVIKRKLGRDFKKYAILGAFEPTYAYEAMIDEIDIGVLFPCNIVVYENKDKGSTVSAIDPISVMGITENLPLKGAAKEMRDRLERSLVGL